ncbi:MAG: 4Fe-4S binding protein [Veillonella parvula]
MLFTVNTEVCTRCGLCVADCPTGLLVMSDAGPVTGKGRLYLLWALYFRMPNACS